MTIAQYWTMLAKRWRLIVICIAVVGLGAYIGSRLMTPLYQSTVLVQVAIRVGSSQADYTGLLASDQLVQTEATLATSDPVLREVASHYSGLSADQLLKEVTATTKLNTQLFEIDVLDASPTRAANLANDIASTLISQQLQAVQQGNSVLQQQIQQDITNTKQQIDATTVEIATLQAQRGSSSKIALLESQLSNLQQDYSQWQAAFAQLELTQAENTNFLYVVQTAQPSLRPAHPNLLLNTGAGLLAGLFLGMLLAVLFEQFDVRVRTSEALTQLLDWPVLATIWRAGPKEDVINPTGNHANVEAFRMLRTNIGFSSIDKPLRTLLVTSALPGDGKSSVAADLAIFMAKAGKTTLLVDADLRRPGQHDLLGLSSDKMGLSNAVLAFSMPKLPETPPFAVSVSDGPVTNTHASHRLHPTTLQQADALTDTSLSLEPFVHAVGIPNLWVMPSGPLPPNPPELLDSKAMQRLLTVIANYGGEVVIFDTPPLLGLSDVSILASKVDGTLVVVDITRANKKLLKQTKAALMQAGAHVLGCVVNKQRRSRHDTSYSYYYYSNDEQNGRKNHNIGKKSPPAVPVNDVRQLEMQNGQGVHSTQNVNSPEKQSS
jgi:tyrosine-protein kinase